MNLQNESLQKIMDNYKSKSNKELSAVIMNLHSDFTTMKNTMLSLTQTLDEIGFVYDKIYTELQARLKFDPTKPELEDANGD